LAIRAAMSGVRARFSCRSSETVSRDTEPLRELGLHHAQRRQDVLAQKLARIGLADWVGRPQGAAADAH